MNKHIPWMTYKHQKTLAIEDRGYLVRPGDPKENWLYIGHVSSPRAESYLSAKVQFFQEPSSHGIEEGRISRLDLRRYNRLVCAELFRGITARSSRLYAYDRGESINHLASDRRAATMYRDLLELLG